MNDKFIFIQSPSRANEQTLMIPNIQNEKNEFAGANLLKNISQIIQEKNLDQTQTKKLETYLFAMKEVDKIENYKEMFSKYWYPDAIENVGLTASQEKQKES